MTETITFTFDARWVWGIGLTTCFLALVGIVAIVLPSTPDKTPFDRFKKLLGVEKVPDFWVLIGSILVALALLSAIAATFAVIYHTIKSTLLDPSTSGPSLGAGTLIIGLLGAPFLIWRTLVAQRTVDIADASLFNEKLAAALENLAARRQVTRVVKDEAGDETVLTEWEDDIVARVTAMERLFGLVEERSIEADRIATIISAYVTELSRVVKPKMHPRYKFLALKEGGDEFEGLDDHEIYREFGIHADEIAEGRFLEWAGRQTPQRSDMQKAVQVIGRLPKARYADPRVDGINLSSSNLQGFDLRGLELEGFNLARSNLQGAVLSRVQLKQADLSYVFLEAAIIIRGDLRDVDFNGSQLNGTLFARCNLDGANFSASNLRFTAMWSQDLRKCNLSQDQIDQMFGDGTVRLADGMERPSHWPELGIPYDDFIDEWQKWLANPDTYTYTPPDPSDPT